MNKKSWFLVFVALVVAGIYVIYFTDWFTPKVIHITSTNQRTTRTTRASRVARANANSGFMAQLVNLVNSDANDDTPTIPIIFKLGKSYKLKEIKVVDLNEWQTNKNCLPLWHLVADTNSVPIDRPFTYGQRIPGMKPLVPGERAQPLKPGIKYRLFITDGSAKGEHDFQPAAKPGATNP